MSDSKQTPVKRMATIPKPRIRLSEIEELQSYLHKEKPVTARIVKVDKPCKVYRRYADKHRLLVVLLRYGSVIDFTQPRRTYRMIEEWTGIRKRACQTIVQQFHRRGNDWRRRRTTPYGPKPHPLPPDVEEYIRSSLYENRFLSISERCQVIRERFGFPIARNRLQRTYGRMGIQYTRVKAVLKSRLNEPNYRREERKEFAKKVTSLMLQQRNVIFFDESSTNLWGHRYANKTWQRPDEPIPMAVNSTMVHNLTMMCAVSNCLPSLYFRVYRSGNEDTVADFMMNLKGEVQRQYLSTKPVLAMDNLMSHKTAKVAQHYDAFRVLFLPAYSKSS